MAERRTQRIEWREIVRAPPDELRRRVDELPDPDRADDPAMLLALAASFRQPGSTNAYAAEPYLDAADELLASSPDEAALRVLAPIVRSVPLRELGRLGEARRLLGEALALVAARGAALDVTTRVDLSAQALLHDGICAMLQGRLDEARRALLRSLHVADARTPAHARAEACGCIALIDLRVGSLRSAEAHIDMAAAAVAELGGAHRLATVPARLASIVLAIERGTLDGVEERLTALDEDTVGTEYAPLARAAWTALLDDADDGVVDILQELQLGVRDWASPNLPAMLHDDVMVGYLISRREAVAARASIERLVPDAAHSQCPDTWRARLELDAGDHAHAITVTDRCLAMGDAHSPRTALFALLVSAAAHAALGDLRTSDVLFARVLSLTAPTGATRPFRLLPRPHLARLVGRARAQGQPAGIHELLDRIEARYPFEGGGLPDTLTPRERVVLEYLIAAETQQRISAALSVSPNTVKTQVRSIYRKLGVASREGAVQRARTLGLID